MSQTVVNALISAAGYLLVAIGFSLIYTCVRFFHFAHGVVLTAGAYVTFALKVWCGLPLSVSMLCGVLASTLLGAGMEWSVYRPLRTKGASAVGLLLSSLGIYVALQALISLTFGSGTQTLGRGEVAEGLLLLGVRLTAHQMATILTSAACWLLTWLLLQHTKIGTMMRAVASNPDLAAVHGLDVNRVITCAFVGGSALAGIAGLMLAFDTDMTPLMGFRALMMGMIAVIIGGVGSIPGAALGALLLGLAQHLTAWWISSRWQDAIVFVILIFFLLVRPQGFLGRPTRSAAV
jgi:branched-chain amino acid transport system permease protein